MVRPDSSNYRIFVLGAGFSCAAGLPVAHDLWREVLRRAEKLSGRAGKFLDDLQMYIEFRKDCDGLSLTPDEVDFENFLAFLDIEHHLGLRGSDTWSADGNEAQVVVKMLIAQILTERMPPKERIPNLYLRFAEALRPGDYVLTFNYDVVLERALEVVGKPFRLFPQRFKKVHSGYAEGDTAMEEVVVLKLHGSIDWFDRKAYRELEEAYLHEGVSSRPEHPVFTNVNELTVVPLLEGPRFPNDPLREMHRVHNVERLYRKPILFHATPWLLNPSSAKILYSGKLKDFWWGLGDMGCVNFGLSIIGFSMPPQDDYARQVLYRLVKNYQSEHWDKEVFGRKKTPLVFVDLRHSAKDKEEFRSRYAFVDWSRAETCFDGFDDGALGLLFRKIGS